MGSTYFSREITIIQTLKKLAELEGIKGIEAVFAADQKFNNLEGYSLLEAIGLSELVVWDNQEGFTPSTLYKKTTCRSAQAFNQVLMNAGLQVKVGSVWVLTELGKCYGFIKKVARANGTGYSNQIFWRMDVLDLIRENQND